MARGRERQEATEGAGAAEGTEGERGGGHGRGADRRKEGRKEGKSNFQDNATKLENLTRSGMIFVPGSAAGWTNGLDGSDGSCF